MLTGWVESIRWEGHWGHMTEPRVEQWLNTTSHWINIVEQVIEACAGGGGWWLCMWAGHNDENTPTHSNNTNQPLYNVYFLQMNKLFTSKDKRVLYLIVTIVDGY